MNNLLSTSATNTGAAKAPQVQKGRKTRSVGPGTQMALLALANKVASVGRAPLPYGPAPAFGGALAERLRWLNPSALAFSPKGAATLLGSTKLGPPLWGLRTSHPLGVLRFAERLRWPASGRPLRGSAKCPLGRTLRGLADFVALPVGPGPPGLAQSVKFK